MYVPSFTGNYVLDFSPHVTRLGEACLLQGLKYTFITNFKIDVCSSTLKKKLKAVFETVRTTGELQDLCVPAPGFEEGPPLFHNLQYAELIRSCFHGRLFGIKFLSQRNHKKMKKLYLCLLDTV